jgi:hypothetical protein
MAELSVAAPHGDPRDIDTGSLKEKHILRASVDPDELFTFRKGALVGIRPGETYRLLEVVLDGTPRADLEIVGVYDDEKGQIDPITDAGAEGEALDDFGKSIRVRVRDGDLNNFDTAAPGANQILFEHVGQPCFAKNDNTLYLTDDSGTLSFAGLIANVNARGKVTLRNTFDIRQQWKAYGTVVSGLTAADVAIVDVATQYVATDVEAALAEVKAIADDALPAASLQSGSATLIGGTVTIAATITASTKITASMTDPGAGAITGFADLRVHNKVIGAPGSFDVTAIDDAKVQIATAVCVLDWHAVG